jgi:hypothetical protein
MSLHRWLGTTLVLVAVAWGLRVLSPDASELRSAVLDPQGLVDRAGPDALVLVAVPVLAWVCWAWGALGLLLTAASTVPGSAGRVAAVLLSCVLPAGARRAAALALGLGLSAVAPTLLAPAPPSVAVATAAAGDELGGAVDSVTVDWPGAPAEGEVADGQPPPVDADAPAPAGSPDWPAPRSGEHVVLRGDCLWDIAADWLHQRAAGAPVTTAQVQQAVQDWWQANTAVIGADPDLLLPGQVLRPPG